MGAEVTTARRQPEKAIQADIVQALRRVGCAVYVLGTHRPAGDYQGTMQTPGVPDLWVFLPRGLGGLWVEVKAPKGRRSMAQEQFRAACYDDGVPYVCGGLPEVMQHLMLRGVIR
jgi:hypothetical protein